MSGAQNRVGWRQAGPSREHEGRAGLRSLTVPARYPYPRLGIRIQEKPAGLRDRVWYNKR